MQKKKKISAAPAQPGKAQKTSPTHCFFFFLNVSWRRLRIHDQVFWVVEVLTVRLPGREAGNQNLYTERY